MSSTRRQWSELIQGGRHSTPNRRSANRWQILSSNRAYLGGGASVRSMLLSLAFAATACASSAREARTDVVIQWNQQVMSTGGPQVQRTLAMVHVAMFDAMNGINRRQAPSLGPPPPPEGANSQAAAAAAAYGVLVRLMPGERSTLQAALARSLADIPDGPGETQGLAYGDLIAKAMFDARL